MVLQRASSPYADLTENSASLPPINAKEEEGGDGEGFCFDTLPDMYCTATLTVNSSDSHVLQ